MERLDNPAILEGLPPLPDEEATIARRLGPKSVRSGRPSNNSAMAAVASVKRPAVKRASTLTAENHST